jgi:CheY-like chemotaxis protein
MPTQSTLLILESDAQDMFLITRAFRKIAPSIRILGVKTVEETIQYLTGEAPFGDRARHPLPTLLLMDLNMSGQNGFDLLKWLQTKSEFNQVPVVILTGSASGRDLEVAVGLGADAYHLKPQDADEMQVLVRDLPARWLSGKSPEQAT